MKTPLQMSPLMSVKGMGSRSYSWTTAPGARNKAIAEAAALNGGVPGQPYNVARGLRSIFAGSAFLPGFVIDGDYAMLDESGFEFIKQCIAIIEEKGIREQGIYRNCGVTSKVQKLMQLALDKRKNSNHAGGGERLNLSDDEWEIRTISSAIKTFLRNLPEPLMTFDLHNQFINAAKIPDVQQRVNHIHFYVYQLPEASRQMLQIIIRHLRRVADLSAENLMTMGNLGVCFGPSLLRPKEETMAAIMDIKFCNVVVEMLIANCHQIFDTKPPQQIGHPCPPKPTHNLVAVMPNEAKDKNITIPNETSPLITSIGEMSFNGGGSEVTTSMTQNISAIGSGIISPSIIAPPPRPGITPRPKSMAVSSSSHPLNLPTNSTTAPPAPEQTGAGSVRQRQPPPPPLVTGHNGKPTQMAQQREQHYHVPTPPFDYKTTVDNSDYASQSSLYSGGRCASSLSHGGGITPSTSNQYAHHQQPVIPNGSPCHRPSGDPNNAMVLVAAATVSNNSSESLNSIGSLNDRSPGTQSISSGGGGGHLPPGILPLQTSAPKAKLAGPYAPSYNPHACENITNRLQKRHSGGSLSGSLRASTSVHTSLGGGGYSSPSATSQQHVSEYASTPLPNQPPGTPSKQQQYTGVHRIPPAYSSFISPNAQLQPRRVRTLYPCSAGHETELSFEPNQIITNVYDSREEGWLVGTLNGKTGLIPANYVTTI